MARRTDLPAAETDGADPGRRPDVLRAGSEVRERTGVGKDRPAPAKRRYFELPYGVAGQRLARPDLDLVSMVSRGPAQYEIDVTVLDAADLRLTRAGVTLAHRVAEGRGEWYLAAPGWAPYLPVETIEPMGEADLPPGLAELVLPFRRHAPLEPVAALHCERSEFVIRGAGHETRAVLHDDRVTVRRGGMTVTRYREVTLQPVDLNRKQLGWLTESLQAVGGTRVKELPQPATRLGVPASALGRFDDVEWDTGTDLEGFVTALLAARLRQWLTADLSLRTGTTHDARLLTEVLAGLRGELRGLAQALEPRWVEDVDQEFDWLIHQLGGLDAAAGRAPVTAGPVLRSQRYLRLLDLVVQSSSVPRLGGAGTAPATEAVALAVQQSVRALLKAGRTLSPTSPSEDWAGLRVLADQAHATTLVARRNLPTWARKVDKRVRRLTELLPGCVDPQLAEIERSVSALGPQQAFSAGRRYEQLLGAQTRARREVLSQWGLLEERLRAAVKANGAGW
ncbi:CYTH domain-containing protein [Desertihabitans aurantiacus]|uniref:hypothetical protein n=1 Tax=Desertihabitans aurantiacus TaxID=2282477 RepID=UPI000DF7B2D1|nr:hypothetical protein [Desertihabitans aurantiacus]